MNRGKNKQTYIVQFLDWEHCPGIQDDKRAKQVEQCRLHLLEFSERQSSPSSSSPLALACSPTRALEAFPMNCPYYPDPFCVMAGVPRSVPWSDWKEWESVCEVVMKVFERNGVVIGMEGEVEMARTVMGQWRSRGAVPAAVMSSEGLVECAVFAAKGGDSLGLRLALSSTVVRLVNSVADQGQEGAQTRSVASQAVKAGLPQVLVDVRHGATHQGLPTLDQLQYAGREAMSWLLNWYWAPQLVTVKGRKETSREFFSTIFTREALVENEEKEDWEEWIAHWEPVLKQKDRSDRGFSGKLIIAAMDVLCRDLILSTDASAAARVAALIAWALGRPDEETRPVSESYEPPRVHSGSEMVDPGLVKSRNGALSAPAVSVLTSAAGMGLSAIGAPIAVAVASSVLVPLLGSDRGVEFANKITDISGDGRPRQVTEHPEVAEATPADGDWSPEYGWNWAQVPFGAVIGSSQQVVHPPSGAVVSEVQNMTVNGVESDDSGQVVEPVIALPDGSGTPTAAHETTIDNVLLAKWSVELIK